ncbi:alpha/beta hydrolase [Stigmatella sp. ncwal1]|uniref:Alpha/beta hydrolase n=1 Tax=Stigmatella ashevillensis TaxID=2995309 RepID=A0ABT5DNA2_9BACT|nr:alpha/beta hydrolase [Stigmatella ashevillena]MDC0713852.1 alpha/beta hydrolase [Stigmatella ashevillena]
MKEDSVIVLLHGSANGSYSWGRVRNALTSAGKTVFAPDMLGYGPSRPPGPAYGIEEEVAHLKQVLEGQGIGRFHLVTHSLGSMFGLHLRRALGERVTRLTLIDPVVVSVLREQGEEAGYAEMESQYQAFMGEAEPASAARFFVEHWSGRGTWNAMGDRARAVIVSLVPKLRLEMQVTRADPTGLAFFAEAPPPAEILIGEKTLVAPQATARQLARVFHAAPVVVPGAAHMIPLTHPEAVVGAVLSKGTP